MPTSSLRVTLDFGTESRLVGRLAATQGSFHFEYDEEFLQDPLPISPLILSARRGVINRPKSRELWGVFQDSLPDSFGMRVLARRMAERGITDSTGLEMLSVVGRRAMGALVYAPAQDEEVPSTPMELGILAEDSEALYRESPARVLEVLVQAAGTAGGARPKVVVGRTADGRLWPDAGVLPHGATRWIIKFHGDDSVHSGVIEGCLTRLAARCRIEVSKSEVLSAADDRRYFATERFDRTYSTRLHLHTLGGLIDARAFDVITYSELLGVALHLTKDLKAAEECFRRLVFNVAVGNRDDHERNFSFLMDATGEWRVSPAYDLTWSEPQRKRTHTLLVNGKGAEIMGSDCIAVATTAGIARRRAEAILDEVLGAMDAFPECAAEVDLVPDVVERIGRDISGNRGWLLRR